MPKMISIAPSAGLSPFIKSYELLEFDTATSVLLKPWYAIPETYLIFFLKEKPVELIDEATGCCIKGTYKVWIQGLSTHYKGLMKFKGNYSIFLIQFIPNGFNRLFNLPAQEFTNNLLEADTLLGKRMEVLLERLKNAKTLLEMAHSANVFLETYSAQRKNIYYQSGITCIVNHILQVESIYNIAFYAREANMSPRNFERKFKEEVGTTPKIFCRSVRFNRALNIKLGEPTKSWTQIAYECGYYDQMHLIRDFKKFAASSPEKFLRDTPPPFVEHTEADINFKTS